MQPRHTWQILKQNQEILRTGGHCYGLPAGPANGPSADLFSSRVLPPCPSLRWYNVSSVSSISFRFYTRPACQGREYRVNPEKDIKSLVRGEDGEAPLFDAAAKSCGRIFEAVFRLDKLPHPRHQLLLSRHQRVLQF